MNELQKAIVLLSGGLDSATCLAIALAKGLRVVALSFDYGQRHHVELDASRRVAEIAHVPRRVIEIDLRQFGHSALTSNIAVPKRGVDVTTIPVTYVPARNTIFLSYALAMAEVEDASSIYIGVNALDYSGYPDCRPEFISAFQRVADVATKRTIEGQSVKIEAPLQYLSKAEIIARGVSLGVDYSVTISCYDPDASGAACGACDSCQLRRSGFASAGVSDPTRYMAYA